MKNLQDCHEHTHSLSGSWPLNTIESLPENPQSLILLLHGYNERGLRIFRKLKRSLPEEGHIIAPNAIFPLPRVKSDRVDFGYAWYFFDKFTQTYSVDQAFSVELLGNLLEKLNPRGLPVTIIGFSQGGYLAPLIGFAHPHVKHVIGIGCEFKSKFIAKKPSFTLTAIHGSADELVPYSHALREIETLKKRKIEVKWHLIEGLKHEITNEVASLVASIMEEHGKESL